MHRIIYFVKKSKPRRLYQNWFKIYENFFCFPIWTIRIKLSFTLSRNERNWLFFVSHWNHLLLRHEYVHCMYNVYISRLRGLCTFLLTLLLYFETTWIFPVHLFLYSYNYAFGQIRWVCERMCHWHCVNENNLHGAFAVENAHVYVCCHTLLMVACIPMYQ